MIVRALQSTFIGGFYRNGPEVSEDGKPLTPGVEFDVDDDTVINPTVLEVVEPPASGKVRLYKVPKPPVDLSQIEEVQVAAPEPVEAPKLRKMSKHEATPASS